MVLFFYNLGLVAVLVLGAPWWLWKMATTHKYRQGLGQRLGRVPKQISADNARPAIWLHAVSVGEVLAVSRLADEIAREFPEWRLLISTTTRTGQALARQRFGEDRVFYFPLDLPWAVNAYLRQLKPTLVVLAETEFWPNLLSACFAGGTPVVVVNARISDRSWPRYRRLRGLWKAFLSRLTRVLAQSETDAERLRQLGCPPDRVSAAGNLKFDVRATREADATRLLREQGAGCRFVVAGSTLEGEEAALLETWASLTAAEANLVLVLAPRHPERFPAVAAQLERSGFAWMRRSQGLRPLSAGAIVLLDTIGELASVYSLASVAFVGGSMVAGGGHNPLEPAQFAVPIVMGPDYANFRAIGDDLVARRAIRIAEKEALAATVLELLRDPAAAKAMGMRARQVFTEQSGATARCTDAIRSLLAERTAEPIR